MQTILILGSGSDIAKAIARRFAQAGYNVQLAGRNKEQMDRLHRDLTTRFGTEVTAHLFDATAYKAHAAFPGALPVLPDVVVYTAGYMCEQADAERNWAEAQNMMEVNYAGAVSILNHFALLFKQRGAGCIVGVSSVAGDRGRGSNFIYGSTKAAFSAYLSGLRNQLYKSGVQVITIKPGFVYTKMTQHLPLPKRLTASTGTVAEKIYTAVVRKKDVVYVKSIWRWIMFLIKAIPESLFKRTNL